MRRHDDINPGQLFKLLRIGSIGLAGNRKLKIYGQLNCASGKRMKKENRIFFKDSAEAITHGFRPCGNCMREQYIDWKKNANIYRQRSYHGANPKEWYDKQ